MSEQTPAPNSPDPPREPEGPVVPAGPEPAAPESVAPESVAPESAAPEFAGPEPEAALAEVAAASPENPEQPPGPPGRDGWSPGGQARIIRDAIMGGNSLTITVLAIFTALVVGGLVNAFSNNAVLHAWGNFFSAPGHAIALA